MIRLALLFLLARPCSATPSFTKEAGVRLSSAVFQASAGAYPSLRIYYIQGGSKVYSATTADGLAFAPEAGVRLSSSTTPVLDIAISSITGCSVLPLTGGGFRMLYSVIGSTGAYRIYSATSSDGLAWANQGLVLDGGLTFVGFPSLVKLASGDWRLFYIQNSLAGNQPASHHIFTALSTNQGATFASTAAIVAVQAGEVSATALTNGKVRLYYTAPIVGQSSNTTILSALSSDANATFFTAESGLRLSTTTGLGALSAPFVARSSDTYGWRLYYNYLPFSPPGISTADAFSALADSPDIQGLSPSLVYRSNAAPQFTITGEIFSSTPTAKLSQSGQADILGTALTRTDDQTITVTFNTQSQALGPWDLTVANANGLSTTAPGKLTIDFLGGQTTLTDNLIRPRQGTSTKIAVTIFNDGATTLKLYTLRGELVSTIADGYLTAGTHNFTWNGTTSLGRTVASGVYVLQTVGPKVNSVSKIVVIK